ncbi:hypothetical protein Tco_0846696 [Tanacetum coccineum]
MWVVSLLHGVNHESWFLGFRRRKNNHRKKTSIDTCTSSMSESDGTLNDATPRLKEVVSPSVVDDTMEKEKLSPVVTFTEPYPPLPMLVATSVGKAHGKSSYANVTDKPSGKKLNFRTLFTSEGNGINVVVLVESIRTISERFTNTSYGFFLGKRLAYLVVTNYVRNTWGKYRLIRSMFSSSTRLFSF